MNAVQDYETVGKRWDSSGIKNSFVSVNFVRDERFAPTWKERFMERGGECYR